MIISPNAPRALVACEYSGRVRDALRRNGIDAYSCDLLECEGDPRYHIIGDALAAAHAGRWSLIICHPPCTHLAVSGARHFATKRADGRQQEGLLFVKLLMEAPCDHFCLENPVSIISSHFRKPDQIIQPWQFGHGETKTTCLWTRNLPQLVPTNIVAGRDDRIHKMPPGPNRWKERSRTYQGIADAMGDQYGKHVLRAHQLQHLIS